MIFFGGGGGASHIGKYSFVINKREFRTLAANNWSNLGFHSSDGFFSALATLIASASSPILIVNSSSVIVLLAG
jgi:hypothetical protein